MARTIKLNSSDWCDLIFENKNKAYGAYKLRQTSTRRHVIAFVVTLLFVGTIAAIPSLLDAAKVKGIISGGIDESYVVAEYEEPKKEEEEIVPPKQETVPKEQLRAAIKYDAPVIVDNDQVKPENELKPVSEVLNGKGVIANYENPNGSNNPNAPSPEVILTQQAVTNTKTEKDPVLKIAPQMPQYPGGTAELMRFLNSNIKYPTIAIENRIEGQVVVTFVVEKDGSITGVKVVKSLDPSCDKEALRVVSLMPKWVAGRLENGQSARVQFTLPVTYSIRN